MAEDGNKEQPIIIIKKKGHCKHAAHGGAWKVAFADFVTAMMAFFIVMWVLAQSEPVKEAVEHYFANSQEYSVFSGRRGNILIDLGLQPSKLGEGKGIEKGKGFGDDRAEIAGEDDEKHEYTFWVDTEDSSKIRVDFKAQQDSIIAAKRVEEAGSAIKEFFEKVFAEQPELAEILTSIKIEMTTEGLRIELLETHESVFFQIGSAHVTKEARTILQKLSKEIGKLPNPVEIEGHTDSRQYSSTSIYSNWELSSDRAHATRRILETTGLWDGQIIKVAGYADRKLRTPENPFDISNRRISILVKHIAKKDFMQ